VELFALLNIYVFSSLSHMGEGWGEVSAIVKNIA
jgi:hypothetical protein